MSDRNLRDYVDRQMSGATETDDPELDEPEPEPEPEIEPEIEDPGDDEDDATTPQTGAEVVSWALENDAELRAEGWDSAQDFLVTAASDARWWLETATLMGWPPEARPQQRDLPAEMVMGAIAAGIPGARLMRDPLHRMRPGSKRRLW